MINTLDIGKSSDDNPGPYNAIWQGAKRFGASVIDDGPDKAPDESHSITTDLGKWRNEGKTRKQ